MSVDKNLFPYDLAIVAIFKNEAPYLQEWLDYHLVAGVEHFYLYNNDSSDNFAEVLAPYIAANIVTLIDFPGRAMQNLAYEDALENFRFDCRYIAFIDLDEFIYPKTNRSVAEVVDEILSRDDKAAALAINWQYFGSNGHETADYSRGVLERFTRRAPDDWTFEDDNGKLRGNIYVKSIVNPRNVDYFNGMHNIKYFDGLKSISSSGMENFKAGNYPITTDKIVIHHYYVKSREEYSTKVKRGDAFFIENYRKMAMFDIYDRNEVFDDGILKYRVARAENFSLETDEQRLRRAEQTLIETLTQCSPLDAPPEFFVGKLETFLTCRALAEQFGTQIGSRSAEEFALVWIYQTLTQAESLTQAEVEQFIRILPEILARPFPFCRKFKQLAQEVILPTFCTALKDNRHFDKFSEFRYINRLLKLI